jgi:hypothetical protein
VRGATRLRATEILLDVKAGNNTRVALVEPTVRAKVHEQCGSR